MRCTLSLTIAITIACSPALAQTSGSLHGFAYDAESGESLIGCNIVLPEIGLGAITNQHGYYTMPVVPAGTYVLSASYIGYKSVERKVVIAAATAQAIDIHLAVEPLQGAATVIVADSISGIERLYRRTISQLELSGASIQQLPQVVEADLLRSLQTLPGIVPVSDYSSAPHVRGGTPDQNLYLVDGTDVYNPEHAFGLFSVFNTDAVKKVAVYKGGFGAEYGGRLSSVLDITHLDGNKNEFEGSAAISLLSSKATVQMPLAGRGSLSASFRRTYFDHTVARLIDSIPPYYFFDGNFKAFIDLNAGNKLTISGFGGRDVLDYTFNRDSADAAGLLYDWGNATGSVRWTSVWTPRLFANLWITGSRFTSDFDLGQIIGFDERNEVDDLTLKGNLEYSHSPELSGRFGFEQKNLSVMYRQRFPDARTEIARKPTHYSSYVSGNWKPSAQWEAEAGLRYHFFDSDRNFDGAAPRLAVKYRPSSAIVLKGAAGLYRQYLNRIPRVFITDIWTTANRFQQASSAQHYIAGYQQQLGSLYQLEIEGYYKSYDHIHAFNEAFLAAVRTDVHENGLPVFTETTGLFHEGNGDTRGAEALLRRSGGSFSGWLGATLSATEYAFANLNDGKSFPPRHDKTVTINGVGDLDVANGFRRLLGQAARSPGRWHLGFNFVYASGQPITRPGSGYVARSLPDTEGAKNFFTGGARDFVVLPGPINGFRLPAYIRLDVTVRHRTCFRGMTWTSYLQVFNLGNRRNIWFVRYEDDSRGGFDVLQEIDTIPMFPILPTLGMHVAF